MRWTIACRACAQTLRATNDQEGRAVRCPCCGAGFVVTRPTPPACPLARRTPPADPPAAGRPYWRRHWLSSAVCVLALAGVVVCAAGAAWADWLGLRAPPPIGVPMMPHLSLGPFSGPAFVPPTDEEEAFDLATPSRPPVAGPPVSTPPLPFVGRIAPCLAVTGDGRLLLTADAAASLRWYDAATLQLRGACRLHQPAYRMAFDPARRMLYTASAARSSLHLSVLGEQDHAVGQLNAYDLSGVLAGRAGPGPLEPARVFPLRANVRSLFLTAGLTRLVYLAEGPRDARLGRIDLGGWTRDRETQLGVGGSVTASLSPEGALHVLSGGRLSTYDPVGWERTSCLRVGPGVCAVAAGRPDRLFLLERRGGLVVHVVDLPGRKVRSRWVAPLVGRVTARTSAAGDRLYLAASAVLDGCIHELNVSGDGAAPVFAGQAHAGHERVIRGGLFLSPDGTLLVTGSGLVFRASS
jgi:hypothetical protein